MTKKNLIERVDFEQWLRAQTWEQNHWLRDQRELARYGKNFIWRLLSFAGIVEKYRGDDRNQWWKQNFDNYKFLPPQLNNCLEVGCGPYSNMRLIREACMPKHLFLSDPLIRTYVKFKMTFVSEMYLKAACYLDDHPLEALPFANDYFDLVVMINVLDHVQDANLCMKNLIRVVKCGGYVIIGQDLTNEEDFEKQPDELKKGHPISLDKYWFDPYLKEDFKEILQKVIPREQGWAPQWHYGTLLYAGQKL